MSAAHDIRGTVVDLNRWEDCGAEELLVSPWRHALGVWPTKDGFSTHPLHWRWTLDASRAPLFATNDDRLWHMPSTIRDVELAHLLEAGELDRLNARGALEVLRRRGRGGFITRQAAGSVEGREAGRCGRHVTLKAAPAPTTTPIHSARPLCDDRPKEKR